MGTHRLGWSRSAGHCVDSGTGGRGTGHDLRVVRYGWCWKGDVSGWWWWSGIRLRFRLQPSDVVQLGNEKRCFFVVVGGPPILESSANSDDLFNLELVRTATVGVVTVNIVPYSCEGRDKSSVDRVVVGEGN